MCVWTERKYSLSINAVLWVWVLAPSPFRPSSPDALRPTHGTAIYTEPSVNGVTFHRALRGIIRCPQVPREAHALMICLLDAANDNAEVWLSQQQIRERTGYAIRTIREWMGRMVRLGFLDPIYPGGRSKSGQKRWASRFRINVESLSEYDTQPASACRSRSAHDRQVPAAQPATAGSATGECLPHDRQQVAPDRLITDSLTDLESAGADECPHDIPTDGMDSRPSPLEEAMQKLLGQSRANFRFRNKEQVANLLREKYDVESLTAVMEECIRDGVKWDKFLQRAWGIGKKDKPEDVTQVKAAKGKYDRFR